MRTLTRRLTRRAALRALFTAGVVAGTAGALAPVLARRAHPGPAARARRGAGPGPHGARGPEQFAEPAEFAEVYRGRHIQGGAVVMVPVAGRAGRVRRTARPAVEVRVDGRPLPVMRRADGSYLSLVNHYESFPTLREAARAAVDELGAAQLAATPPPHGH